MPLPASLIQPPPSLALARAAGYELLQGEGLEIGGFENPAPLAPRCRVRNCDLWSPDEARSRFPELAAKPLPSVDHHVNLDGGGLWMMPPLSQDFIVCNHVLEHLADPIGALAEFIRVVRPGGHLVLAVPDHRYTADRVASPTPWIRLRSRYLHRKRTAQPEDYAAVHPRMPGESDSAYLSRLSDFAVRHEHLNVWDSRSFIEFLESSWRLLGATASLEHIKSGDENRIECFTVWRLH